MSDSHQISLKVFTTFLTSLHKLGPEKSHTVLQGAIDVSEADSNEIIEFIFTITCKEFLVKREEILTGVSKDGRRHNASVCLVYLFNKYTTLTQADISKMIKKSQPLICALKKEIKGLSENVPHEKETMKKIMFCENKVEEKLKSNNTLTK